MPILISFAKSRKLVHSSLAQVLREIAHPDNGQALLDASGEWTALARREGILFDLSSVQWCDLTACVHFLLIVERALKDKLPQVMVALPDPNPTPSEVASSRLWARQQKQEMLVAIEDTQKRRGHALRFLSKIHFLEALQCRHLPEAARARLKVLSDYGSSPGRVSTKDSEQISVVHGAAPPDYAGSS